METGLQTTQTAMPASPKRPTQLPPSAVLEILDTHFGVKHSTGAIIALLLSLDGDSKNYQCDVLLSAMESHGITLEHLRLTQEQPDCIDAENYSEWEAKWDALDS